MDNNDDRRLMRVEVTRESLSRFLQQGARHVENLFGDDIEVEMTVGLPNLAKIVHAEVSQITGTITLYAEHESFEPVSEGSEIPKLELMCDVRSKGPSVFLDLLDSLPESILKKHA